MFIVIEGIDGAGTTTQAALLASYMIKQGYPVLLTREPSVSQTGKLIRSILKSKDEEVNHTALFNYFMMDRTEHIREVIKPWLNTGGVVISDRYAYSTWVYQQDHVSRAKIEKATRELNHIAPDLVCILDIDAQTALKRVDTRRGAENAEIFEGSLAKAKKYRQRYIELCGNAWSIGDERIFQIPCESYKYVPLTMEEEAKIELSRGAILDKLIIFTEWVYYCKTH